MNAYKYCMRHYADFSGRASRSEYWLFALVFMVIYAVCFGIDYAVFNVANTGIAPLTTLAGLVHLIPSLAVAVRRLHDTDRSGWWLLIGFVPLIGTIWILILLCLRGVWGPNRYGAGTELVDSTSPVPLRG